MTGIILAYDKSTFLQEDEKLLEELAPYIDMVKVGLETVYAEEEALSVSTAALVTSFVTDELGMNVMFDAKLSDIGNTVQRAAHNILKWHPGVRFLTVMANISGRGLQNVAEVCTAWNTLALGVTLLTDISEEECEEIYGASSTYTVERLAKRAHEHGISGTVCSPKELPLVRKAVDTITITPGIRPLWSQQDDQQRTMTPAEAAKEGTDFIVIGRPILDPPPEIGTPAEAARLIREEVERASR